MLGLGAPELLLIAFVVVILFGYKRIPDLFGGVGKGIRDFKKELNAEDEKPETATGTDNQASNDPSA